MLDNELEMHVRRDTTEKQHKLFFTTCGKPGLGGYTLGEASKLCALGSVGCVAFCDVSECLGQYLLGDPSYSAMGSPPITFRALLDSISCDVLPLTSGTEVGATFKYTEYNFKITFLL